MKANKFGNSVLEVDQTLFQVSQSKVQGRQPRIDITSHEGGCKEVQIEEAGRPDVPGVADPIRPLQGLQGRRGVQGDVRPQQGLQGGELHQQEDSGVQFNRHFRGITKPVPNHVWSFET